MDNNIPHDLPPDDDTEEMEPREYRPIDFQDQELSINSYWFSFIVAAYLSISANV